MAQLERLIAVLFEKNGTQLTLQTDQAISVTFEDGAVRPVTKNPASFVQVLGLIKEIVPEAHMKAVDKAAIEAALKQRGLRVDFKD